MDSTFNPAILYSLFNIYISPFKLSHPTHFKYSLYFNFCFHKMFQNPLNENLPDHYCGLHEVTTYLYLHDLKEIDKSSVIKQILSLHVSTPSTLAHHLIDKHTLTLELHNRGLPFRDTVMTEYFNFQQKQEEQ